MVRAEDEQFPAAVFSSFDAPVKRIVENQEEIATKRITANPAEQDLLESLIEQSKPGSISGSKHYLLGTPFRYPPLRHGSRFGKRSERWMFYGSLDTLACLAECAYYRFVFYFDQQVPPPMPPATSHTLFSVQVASAACVDLRVGAYDDLRSDLTSIHSYRVTQALGRKLRDQDCEVVVFASARGDGVNVGVFAEEALNGDPMDYQTWMSQVTGKRVMFRGPGGVFQFPVDPYLDSAGRFIRVSAS